MQQYTTMTGKTLEELPAILDAELPAEAYTSVPGGADLTDIDPGWMRRVLNQTFGLCGLGWGYDYQSGDIRDQLTGETGQRAHEGTVARLEFWYILVDEAGEQKRCFIPASGGSENRNASYALKGAITNAIGQASSNLGFQESVYLGHRSHKTVRGSRPGAPAPRPAVPPAKPAVAAKPAAPVASKPAPAPAKPAPNGSKPAAAPAAAPAAVAEAPDDLDGSAGDTGGANPGDFIVPVGKHEGKTLAQAAADEEGWLDKAANAQNVPLREAARAYQAWLAEQSDADL